MADFPYEGQLIADPVTFQRAPNSQVYIYDADDTSNSTPLPLKDATGLPTTNPLISSADAFVKPIYAPSQDIKYVGAGLTVFVSSAKGMRDAAAASAMAAEEARGEAQAAAANAANAAAAQLETAKTAATGAAASAATALAEATAAKAAAEAAAAASSGGGVAIKPTDPDVLIISTKNDGTVALKPSDSDVLTITT